MIFNEIKKEYLNLDSPVLIVGSGPAGISAALDLEKKNISSIIIEAGSEFYDEKSQSQYEGQIIGDKLESLSQSRLRQLGGTSGIWGGWCRPFESYDFEKWLIKKKDIDPFLEEACSILEIQNNFRTSSLSQDVNQIEYQYSNIQFGSHYKEHLNKSYKIKIFLNSQLTYFESVNGNITNAVVNNNDKSIKVKSNHFILAAGGIENSRILLWSRIKNKRLLDKELPIGKMWMHHPFIYGGKGIVYKTKLNKRFSKKFLDYEGPVHFTPSENFLSQNNLLSCSMHIIPNEDKKLKNAKQIIREIACFAPKLGNKLRMFLEKKQLYCGNIKMHLEENYESNNYISLDTKKDLSGVPLPRLNYLQSKSTIKSCKKALMSFANFCVEENIGRIALSDDIVNENKIQNIAGGGYHHSGGTIMGVNKNNSVVDRNLKVHNTNNLYVLGSSTFTSIGYVNPTLSIIQFSLKLSKHIKEKLA